RLPRDPPAARRSPAPDPPQVGRAPAPGLGADGLGHGLGGPDRGRRGDRGRHLDRRPLPAPPGAAGPRARNPPPGDGAAGRRPGERLPLPGRQALLVTQLYRLLLRTSVTRG